MKRVFNLIHLRRVCGLLLFVCAANGLIAQGAQNADEATAAAQRWTAAAFGSKAQAAGTETWPFSFQLGELGSRAWLARATPTRSTRTLDAARTEQTLTWRDAQSGLEVRCVTVQYADFPAVEWTLHIKNIGTTDTAILSNIQALDGAFAGTTPGHDYVLHHNTGSVSRRDDYEPHITPLGPGATQRVATSGGRPSESALPFFNVAWGSAAADSADPAAGVLIAIGWPGQWGADFVREGDGPLHVRAGQEQTHFKLHPGEEVRAPLIALLFYTGDPIDGQNAWRRWMIAHNTPRPGGDLMTHQIAGCSSHYFGEMAGADEASQITFIDRYRETGFDLDYWWMDAGWYPNRGGWPDTGTWEIDRARFPCGFRPISEHAHAQGVKTILWFEPERVRPGTWLDTEHPDWLLGPIGEQKLLDLGNEAARMWLTDHVHALLESEAIDLYRQDFNMDSLPYWRANDAPDRQGISEIRHVTGYLAFWDELLRRNPKLRIDTCSSGGRRLDLETLRRSVPLWRSDYILEPIGVQACGFAIASWIPFTGTGVQSADLYSMRSWLSPYVNLLWDARNPELDYPLLRKLIEQWREIAPLYAGDYYPLTPYSLEKDAWLAWQYHDPAADKGAVQAFRRAESAEGAQQFKLRGLDPAAQYTWTDLDQPEQVNQVSGRELMEQGLLVAIAEQPGARIITYQRAQEGQP